MTRPISRRQFWRIRPGELLRATVTGRPLEGQGERQPIRPPGALPDEAQFLATCERCGKCEEACPHDSIAALGPDWGAAEGTPALDPNTTPCRWCPSWDCIAACPSGALALVVDGTLLDADGEAPPFAESRVTAGHVPESPITAAPRPAPIAAMEFHPEHCLNEQGILCDDCRGACPPGVKAISFADRRPVVAVPACVGCGLCAWYCEAEEPVFRIIPLDRGRPSAG